MNFTSAQFLLFFPVVCLLFWAVPDRFRRGLLLISSYLFYMSWKPIAALLLFVVTLVTYVSAKRVQRSKVWLYVGTLIPLVALALFKNANFLLVAGISFYTFQSLSYVIDVYHGSLKPEESFLDYSLYVSFFPQLVAGPIERPGSLLPQLKEKKIFHKEDANKAMNYLLRGYYKKLVVADLCGLYVDPVFAVCANGENVSAIAIILATFLFAFQIYADFSGYSDIARGCALFFGVRLMENFRFPYFAKSIREFWRCWHISLTSWFTDYVYIPLGGSRKGKLLTYRNILIVFLLSGIWHGFALHFVVWGLLHGIFMVAERILSEKRGREVSNPVLTFFLVLIAWIFFRAENLPAALHMLTGLFMGWTMEGLGQTVELMELTFAGVSQMVLALLVLIRIEKGKISEKADLTLFLTIAFAWLFLLGHNQNNVFLYFQF